MDRRHFLRAASYALALPFLESLAPGARNRPGRPRGHAKRLVCVGPQLGFYGPEFFASGADPKLIRPLDAAGLAGDFTTLSGLDHKGPLGNGHDYVYSLFTGKITPSISLDQFVAPELGRETRYESFQLCCGAAQQFASLSFSAAGVPLPATNRPSLLFAKIFGAGSVALEQQTYLIDSGKSLLDELWREASSVRSHLGRGDRDKLDQYFSSIRALETRLGRRGEWLERPFPEPPRDLHMPAAEFVDGSLLLENEDLMWDLIALAIQNDSTRVVSLTIPNVSSALWLDGELMPSSYHRLSHHGNDPATIADLTRIEERHMRGAARFLATLAATPDEDGKSLLDTTVTILGSAMGDAATHGRTNFPLLVAGGGFQHKRHLSCGEGALENEMACDLFVSALHRLGFEVDRFGSSKSDLDHVLS